MKRVPYPTLHTGLTPDDIPYGYSAYNTIFDDGRGYDPQVVGHDTDENGRQVIIVALSPGNYVGCTMVSVGWDLELASNTVVKAWMDARSPGIPPDMAPHTGSAKGPNVGH